MDEEILTENGSLIHRQAPQRISSNDEPVEIHLREVRRLAECSRFSDRMAHPVAHTKDPPSNFRVLGVGWNLRILGMGRKSNKNNALPEPLDMLILKILSRENLHGYGIVQAIHRSSGDEILIEEGSLYPALQRLEANGWVDGEWGLSQANRRARIYKLTAKGRKRLDHERSRYEQVTLAIARLMGQE